MREYDKIPDNLYYIHANSKNHGIQNDFRNYPWSSYLSILSGKPTSLKREVVLDWFGGKKAFSQFHDQIEVDLTRIEYLIIEDD